MYRIFGCKGDTSSDVIIDGLSRAFADGAQVLSLSLGGLNGWSEDPENVVVQRIADKGIFVSIAAGNEGADGIFELSTPGASLGAIAVASVDNIDFVTWNAVLGNGSQIVHPLFPLSLLMAAILHSEPASCDSTIAVVLHCKHNRRTGE
jgi:subtilisin family serine protease